MTTPPQEPHDDPNLRSGDHEPTVDFTKPEPTTPLPTEPSETTEPTSQLPPPPPPPTGTPAGAPQQGAPQYGAPGYGTPQYGAPQQGAPQYGAPGYAAPYGYDPKTGRPFSDKSKLIAGLLQILLPLGIGRMYAGQVSLGVIQLVVVVITCGVGSIWPFIDGILMLVGDPTDAEGRPLRS